jgi:hypothetical protein
MKKDLSKSVRDSLAFHGWKLYEGDNFMYVGAWVRGDVAMTIHNGRTIKNMFHVGFLTPDSNNTRFVTQAVLLDIIEKQVKE